MKHPRKKAYVKKKNEIASNIPDYCDVHMDSQRVEKCGDCKHLNTSISIVTKSGIKYACTLFEMKCFVPYDDHPCLAGKPIV